MRLRRRYVNMMVANYFSRPRPTFSLHRIDPWRFFYPTRAQALSESANKKTTTMEHARLPRSAISFFYPCPPDYETGYIWFNSLGRRSNNIISTDQDGNTLLYDAASRAVRAMPAPHAPKYHPISLPVGDDLYLLNRNPGLREDHPFEALVYHRDRYDRLLEGWEWRSLPPLCPSPSPSPTYNIKAYSVVGDTQIWVSTASGGTYSFDTTSSVWSMAGEWALPFCGRIEYAPELGLWFGFSSKHMQFAASDLWPPLLHRAVWDEPLQERWVLKWAYLLPLGAGKFCIARLFDMAEEGWRRDRDGDNYSSVENFAVFTGVEVERGSRGELSMIRHKSTRYSTGRRDKSIHDLL